MFNIEHTGIALDALLQYASVHVHVPHDPMDGRYVQGMAMNNEREGYLNQITVLLVDDASILRKTVKQLLETEPKIKLLGEADCFQLALSMAVALKPNVILLDLHMPDDYEFKSAFVKSELSRCGSRVLAMSFSGAEDQESKLLAEAFGAVAMLDKANLHEILIPEILSQKHSNAVLREVRFAAN